MREILYDWNPWWSDKEQVEKYTGQPRTWYLRRLLEHLTIPHVISLVGIRRCGKTTLMYQMIKYLLTTTNPQNIVYLNLDDDRLVGYENILESLVTEYRRIHGLTSDSKQYVFLDEIQNVPGWEKWIKRRYDRKENIKFIVSGSSSALLASDYSSLLTGRNITIGIRQLSFKEYLDFNAVGYFSGNVKRTWEKNRENEDRILHHLEAYMMTGGFPEVVLGVGGRDLLEQYFKDILYRDIILRHSIRQPAKMERLAIYMLRNYSNLLSFRRVANSAGLSTDTAKEYVNYFENVFLIASSKHFTYSTMDSLRERQPIKVYATDLGMAKILSIGHEKNIGRSAENIAALELSARYDQIYYWRNKHEVDIIIPKKSAAIQVCYGEEKLRERSAFMAFPEKAYRKILLSIDRYEPEGEVRIFPLWTVLLSRVGRGRKKR